MIRISAILAGLAAVTVAVGSARAEDAPPTVYHVTQTTFGCVDPAATRALTDPVETRGADTPWFKSVFDDGHCVTITPRSPWKLLSVDGDVALMSYAGTIGQPGTYNLRVDLLVNPLGNHPAETPPEPAPQAVAPPTEVAPLPAAAPPPIAEAQPPGPKAPTPLAHDPSSATALAPQPDATAPSGAATSSAARWTWGWLGWVLVGLAILAGGLLFALRRGSSRLAAHYPLRLPDHVLIDAKRLAEANGAPLDQFLTALVAERIGEMKSAQTHARLARESRG
jgi:hypothetical protein